MGESGEDATQLYSAAMTAHQAGRLAEAEGLYRRVMAVAPGHAGALHHMGLAVLGLGRGDEAIGMMWQSVQMAPDIPGWWLNLALALSQAGRKPETANVLSMAASRMPGDADIAARLGVTLAELGRPTDAQRYLQVALSQPRFQADLHVLLAGAVAWRESDPLVAISLARQAHAHAPGNLKAVTTEMAALSNMGVDGQAADLAMHLWENGPGDNESGDRAIDALRKAGRFDESEALLRRVVSRAKTDGTRFSALLSLGWSMTQSVHRPGWDLPLLEATRIRPDLRDPWWPLLYFSHCDPTYTPERITTLHREWATRFCAEPVRARRPWTSRRPRDPQRRIRLGYSSAEASASVGGYYLERLLALHDRDQFDVVLFDQTTDRDPMNMALRSLAAECIPAAKLEWKAMADLVAGAEIDVMVDLSLHARGAHIEWLATHPAAVTAAYMGYPGSTGVPGVDYKITTRLMDPPGVAEAVNTERLAYLPGGYLPYKPVDRTPEVGPLPSLRRGTTTFGCINVDCKLNTRVLRTFAEIMRRTPGSRLILLSGSPRSRRQVTLAAVDAGIDVDRLQFFERDRGDVYYATYNAIDIQLDPWPYNGHATSLDGLWMGVPMVTMCPRDGRGPATARAGLQVLTTLGLEQYVAYDEAAYVELAVALSGDLPRLAQLRATLRGRMQASPHCDHGQLVRGLEALYRQWWTAWCRA